MKFILTSEYNINYKSVDGILFTKNMDKIVSFPANSPIEQYSIPNGVVDIAEYAFHGCRNLISINIPNSVKSIGDDAFASYCLWGSSSNLEELHISNEYPESLNIASHSFSGLRKCTLYIPIGTGYAYRHDSRFLLLFKEIKIEKQ